MLRPSTGETMDYYQGVVAEYLRADRAVFINTEFYLQLEDFASPAKDSSWWVDILAISVLRRTAFLCEVTYSQSLNGLIKRLALWAQHWPGVLNAFQRDAGIAVDWTVRPWLFIPKALVPKLLKKVTGFPAVPCITPLEMTAPWLYRNWDRRGEQPKPGCVPPEMCA